MRVANQYTKAQMKIQQMAFMIIAIVIFFSMVALVYFAVTLSQLKGTATDLAEEEAMELAFSLVGTPEFLLTADPNCPTCLDLDKAMAFYQINEEFGTYNSLWNLDYLQIEKIYPKPTNSDDCTGSNSDPNSCECDITNYNTNNCKFITLKDSPRYTAKTAIVALAFRDPGNNGEYRFELGRIHVSAKNITQ